MSDAARVFSRGLVATLTLDQWRLFIQIADLGSLTKVAALRDGAQSAVSRQLAAMGYSRRPPVPAHGSRRGLTEAGRRLYPRVLAWLEAGEALGQDLARQVEQPAGQVCIGVLSSIDPQYLSRAYLELSRRYPGIRLRVRDGVGAAVDEWLENGEVDIGILPRSGRGARRRDSALFTARHLLVGAPDSWVAGRRTVPFAGLQGLPLVLAGAPSAFRRQMDQLARRMGVTLTVALECDSLALQKHMVLQGGLYAVLAEHAVLRDMQAGALAAARIVEPGIRRGITLAMSEVRPTTQASREVARILRLCLEPWRRRDPERIERRRAVFSRRCRRRAWFRA